MAIVMPRTVRPEILDSLPAHDPAAQRGRRDLRMVNALMGNFSWIKAALLRRQPSPLHIIEIGAGEGRLCQTLARTFPSAKISALDLAPRPAGLADAIEWQQGDLFQQLPSIPGNVLVGVMIAHHFSPAQLCALGRLAANFDLVCFCEPWRSPWSRALGRLLLPAVGAVTRHDMLASIDAGFVPGELSRLLEHSGSSEEYVDFRGSLRWIGHRK